jgi:hypothetical protein
MRLKTRADAYLADLLAGVGVDTQSAADEYAFLADRLSAAEIMAVARLMEHALVRTHNVGHLPSALGRQAIRCCIIPRAGEPSPDSPLARVAPLKREGG